MNRSRTYTLLLHIYATSQYIERWRNPVNGGSAIAVKGILLEATATTKPPPLRPRRALMFGDSITEGINTMCQRSAECNECTLDWGFDCNAGATEAWPRMVAAAFDAEYSQVGFGSLGWTVAGGGQVPPLFTPGNDALSSWNEIYQGVPRTFDNIDFVFVNHATNDGLRNASAAAVIQSVQGWLKAMRAAVGPKAYIFLQVPFGGFGAANAPAGALKTAYVAYRAEAPGDAKTLFIDLGATAAVGLECPAWTKGCLGAHGSVSQPQGSIEACDGIHPRGGPKGVSRHGELAAMLSVQAAMAMASCAKSDDMGSILT